MTWEQIKEIEKNDFAIIGHHSHTHDYLIDKSNEEFFLILKKQQYFFKKLDIFQHYFLILLVNIQIYERLYF